jgi:PDZ domain-containing protein
MKRRLRYVLLAIAVTALLAAAWIRLPYYAVGPGPAREVTPLIRFDGPERYESSGKLVMTTVRWYQVTPIQAMITWIDPSASLISEDVLYRPGTDRDEERRRSISDMDQSKIDAAVVVLSRLTDYPKEHGGGAIIEGTVPTCPAAGRLFPGDVVRAIDGRTIDSRNEASRAIAAAPRGEPLTFRVEVAGEEHDVEVTRDRCIDEAPKRSFVGINMVQSFPFSLSIESGDIGGPSAGLMWALGLYDLLTPGDLTGGRTVAGTGSIALDGTVGPIGGITDKVVAAERAGADVFLVPVDDMPELEVADRGTLQIIPVATFDEALEALGVADPPEARTGA